MKSEPERPRTLREIAVEVEAEEREWTRRRLQQRLQEEADRQGGISPPAAAEWCIGARAGCNCEPSPG